jgi:hypothetical protein
MARRLLAASAADRFPQSLLVAELLIQPPAPGRAPNIHRRFIQGSNGDLDWAMGNDCGQVEAIQATKQSGGFEGAEEARPPRLRAEISLAH